MGLLRPLLLLTAFGLASLPAKAGSFHPEETRLWNLADRDSQGLINYYKTRLLPQIEAESADRPSDTDEVRRLRKEVRDQRGKLAKALTELEAYLQEKSPIRKSLQARRDAIVQEFDRGEGLSFRWIPLVYDDVTQSGSLSSLSEKLDAATAHVRFAGDRLRKIEFDRWTHELNGGRDPRESPWLVKPALESNGPAAGTWVGEIVGSPR